MSLQSDLCIVHLLSLNSYYEHFVEHQKKKQTTVYRPQTATGRKTTINTKWTSIKSNALHRLHAFLFTISTRGGFWRKEKPWRFVEMLRTWLHVEFISYLERSEIWFYIEPSQLFRVTEIIKESKIWFHALMCQGLNSLYWGWSSHLSPGIPFNWYIKPYYKVDDHPYHRKITGV